MNRQLRISLLVGVAMVLTAAATRALTPATRLADARDRFDLAASVPTHFAGWSVDATLAPVAPNPDSQAALDRIYDQTLGRTYVDADGQRVMLSIAYGGDQSKALQLHLPEVCYVAQGFQIVQKGEGVLATGFGPLPVKRLVARADMRNEPITYWITVGDQATRAGLARKVQLLAYGLSGKIPDGMLVRVSTIDADPAAAYRLQDRFSQALLAALSPQSRTRLLGKIGATQAPASAPVAPHAVASVSNAGTHSASR
jgi:EpsI family protein